MAVTSRASSSWSSQPTGLSESVLYSLVLPKAFALLHRALAAAASLARHTRLRFCLRFGAEALPLIPAHLALAAAAILALPEGRPDLRRAKLNSDSGSTDFLINHGHATRSTFLRFMRIRS